MQTYILLTFHQYLNGERITWHRNKTEALKDRQRENKAWRKRAKQLFKPVKSDATILESEPELSEEEQFEQLFFGY